MVLWKKSRSLVPSKWLCPCHVQWTSNGEKMDQRFHMQKMARFTHRTCSRDGCPENWQQIRKWCLEWPNPGHASALNYLALLGAEHPDERRRNILSENFWNLRESCLLEEKLFWSTYHMVMQWNILFKKLTKFSNSSSKTPPWTTYH